MKSFVDEHIFVSKKDIQTRSYERICKQKQFFRGFFHGKKMIESLSAMEIAFECHTGFRKGGELEVSHQFEIVGMILQVFEHRITTKQLDRLVAAAFLHDVVEDYRHLYCINALKKRFSKQTIDMIARVTKDESFEKNDECRTKYYEKISESLWAIFLKCFDRLHNLQSMSAGFSIEKQMDYIEETVTYFYPMIKAARLSHPEFYLVFILIKQQMETIIRLSAYAIRKEQNKLENSDNQEKAK